MGKKTKKNIIVKKKSLKGGTGFGDNTTKIGSNKKGPASEYGGLTFPDYTIDYKINSNNIEISIKKQDDMDDKLKYSFWIFEEKNPIPINSDMEFADKKTGINLKENIYKKEINNSIFIQSRSKEIDDEDMEGQDELKKDKNNEHLRNYVYTDFSQDGRLVCTPLLNKFTDVDNNPTIARLGDELLGTVPPEPTPKAGTLIQSNTGKKIVNFNFYSCLNTIKVKPYQENEVTFTEKEVDLPSPSPNPKNIKLKEKLLECSIALPEKIDIPTHDYEYQFDESLNEHDFKCIKYPHLINYYEPRCDLSVKSDSFDLVSGRTQKLFKKIEIKDSYSLKEYLDNSIINKPNFKFLIRLVLPKKEPDKKVDKKVDKKPYVKFIQLLNVDSKLKIKNISVSMRPGEDIIKIIDDYQLLLDPYKREWDDNEYYRLFDGVLHEEKVEEKVKKKKESSEEN